MSGYLKIVIASVFALLLTGFVGASFDVSQAQAWGRWGAGSGPVRRALGVERRQARRAARHGAYASSAGSYSGSGSSGSYSGSGSAGSSGAGSAGSYSGYSAPPRRSYTYGSYNSGCPNCGTLSRWR